MSRPYQVRVEGLQFVAAHFATFGGGCEPLHGHNYSVAAELEGSLDADEAWVFDFVRLKTLLRGLCHQLDHRFLLQAESRLLQIESDGREWRVRTPTGAAYVLPAADVVSLPIDNTTAERLAQWFCGRLWQEIEASAANVQSATVQVWEGPDQCASFRQERLR